MSKLAKFVYDTRVSKGLSQSEFAKVLGLTYVTISNIENDRSIGSKALRALSKYTGIKASELKEMKEVK